MKGTIRDLDWKDLGLGLNIEKKRKEWLAGVSLACVLYLLCCACPMLSSSDMNGLCTSAATILLSYCPDMMPPGCVVLQIVAADVAWLAKEQLIDYSFLVAVQLQPDAPKLPVADGGVVDPDRKVVVMWHDCRRTCF